MTPEELRIAKHEMENDIKAEAAEESQAHRDVYTVLSRYEEDLDIIYATMQVIRGKVRRYNHEISFEDLLTYILETR